MVGARLGDVLRSSIGLWPAWISRRRRRARRTGLWQTSQIHERTWIGRLVSLVKSNERQWCSGFRRKIRQRGAAPGEGSMQWSRLWIWTTKKAGPWSSPHLRCSASILVFSCIPASKNEMRKNDKRIWRIDLEFPIPWAQLDFQIQNNKNVSWNCMPIIWKDSPQIPDFEALSHHCPGKPWLGRLMEGICHILPHRRTHLFGGDCKCPPEHVVEAWWNARAMGSKTFGQHFRCVKKLAILLVASDIRVVFKLNKWDNDAKAFLTFWGSERILY